ncbi:MAG: hypothetical protein U9R68_07545 [Planctomycetota bacterium]|nr:hypothetical protein [Planctomycetota bacterium]
MTAGELLVAEVSDWRVFLSADDDEATRETMRRHGRTGRPLGDAAFIARPEEQLDRPLRRRKPGPKPKRKR